MEEGRVESNSEGPSQPQDERVHGPAFKMERVHGELGSHRLDPSLSTNVLSPPDLPPRVSGVKGGKVSLSL